MIDTLKITNAVVAQIHAGDDVPVIPAFSAQDDFNPAGTVSVVRERGTGSHAPCGAEQTAVIDPRVFLRFREGRGKFAFRAAALSASAPFEVEHNEIPRASVDLDRVKLAELRGDVPVVLHLLHVDDRTDAGFHP